MIKPEDSKENEDDLLYGIQHQTLFLRIRDQSINQFDNYRYLLTFYFNYLHYDINWGMS